MNNCKLSTPECLPNRGFTGPTGPAGVTGPTGTGGGGDFALKFSGIGLMDASGIAEVYLADRGKNSTETDATQTLSAAVIYTFARDVTITDLSVNVALTGLPPDVGATLNVTLQSSAGGTGPLVDVPGAGPLAFTATGAAVQSVTLATPFVLPAGDGLVVDVFQTGPGLDGTFTPLVAGTFSAHY